jgi:hypothetical protein
VSSTVKIKVVATTVVLASVGAVWYATFGDGSLPVRPGTTPSPAGDDNYVLSVTWQPSVLNTRNPVLITVYVDGVALPRRVRHLSPYGETMTAVHGARVKLTATTGHREVTRLDCVILRNGTAVPHGGHDVVNGPGLVTCTA